MVFIRETATLFKEYATMKDVALELHMPPSLPMWFDRKQMLKVINNLISNAMKHTPQGGTIAIYVEQQGDKALIKVTDTGKGIAKEELANVFGRFYQVRGFESFSALGTGIGLNLTQGIVKLHHGTITVDSTLGKGTTFTVTLPISKNAFAPDEIDDKPAATKIEYKEEQEKSENSKADNATANTPGSTTVETQTSDTTATPTDEARPTILIVEDARSCSKRRTHATHVGHRTVQGNKARLLYLPYSSSTAHSTHCRRTGYRRIEDRCRRLCDKAIQQRRADITMQQSRQHTPTATTQVWRTSTHRG